MSKVTSKSS